MQKMGSAIILIILGIIVLAFPALGYVPAAIITGFLVLFLGLGLLLSGISELDESAGLGVLEIVLGIIALILGIGFIINSGLFAFVAGFIVWIAGIFLIISGIIGIMSKTGNGRWTGVVAIIMLMLPLLLRP